MTEPLNSQRKTFSVCVPAYNRAVRLAALLDSVYAQDFKDFEIVICEDDSPERSRIRTIAQEYIDRYPGALRYVENATNLGYDGNVRRLVELAGGEFCFFMGNDDLMCAGALNSAAELLKRYPNVGVILRSYAWFDGVPEKINQTMRYFTEEREFPAGAEAIRVSFRRSGVLSGYIVHRDSAYAIATSKFDGTLYYQLHLTANVLATRNAVFTPAVLVLCRAGEPPEFGASGCEKGKYVPGRYTPQARLNMVAGALSIVANLKDSTGIDVVADVEHDYADYFYPYIKDQLGLSFHDFMRLYRAYGRMGFDKYSMFHLYCIAGYLLGEARTDGITRFARGILGRSPHFGVMAAKKAGAK